MLREQAVSVLDTLLDVNTLNISETDKAQVKEALETLKTLARDSKNGLWIYTERTEFLAGGGTLLLRGYECSNCKGFTRKKTGVKDYCNICGSKNVKEISEEVK